MDMTGQDTTDGGRKQRGLEIAARLKITRQGQGWSVPSQSSGTKYTVTGFPTESGMEAPRCTCPDHETRMVKCKHLWAVEYVLERERNADGAIVKCCGLSEIRRRPSSASSAAARPALHLRM
jgi:uncharacterized Zn finger protein